MIWEALQTHCCWGFILHQRKQKLGSWRLGLGWFRTQLGLTTPGWELYKFAWNWSAPFDSFFFFPPFPISHLVFTVHLFHPPFPSSPVIPFVVVVAYMHPQKQPLQIPWLKNGITGRELVKATALLLLNYRTLGKWISLSSCIYKMGMMMLSFQGYCEDRKWSSERTWPIVKSTKHGNLESYTPLEAR